MVTGSARAGNGRAARLAKGTPCNTQVQQVAMGCVWRLTHLACAQMRYTSVAVFCRRTSEAKV